jgi:hypothetical protein
MKLALTLAVVEADAAGALLTMIFLAYCSVSKVWDISDVSPNWPMYDM